MDLEDNNPAPKKRVRTISTLTQEQIRKKRDNDREAQRAFRERTKTRIQVLEDELAVLKSERNGQDSSSIQVLRTLREENAALRMQLRQIRDIADATTAQAQQQKNENENEHASTITDPRPSKPLRDRRSARSDLAIAQSDISNPQLPPESTIDQGNSEVGITLHRRSLYDPVLDQTIQFKGPEGQEIDLDRRVHKEQSIADFNATGQTHHSFQVCEYPQSPPRSTGFSPNDHAAQDSASTAIVHQQDDQFVQNPTFSPGPSTFLPTNLDHQSFDSAHSGTVQRTDWVSHDKSLSHPSTTTTKTLENTESDEYLDGRIMTGPPLRPSSLSPHATTSSPSAMLPSSWVQPETIEQVSMYNILPKHLAATCPLDQILIDFLTSRRVLAAQGTPIATLLGPPKPSISGLINPKFKIAAHAASRVMVDVVSTFTDTNLREQLGFLYIMYTTMRWQIAPNQDTFENLPLWLRPTVLQVMIPHAAWIDNIPWPAVRDLLIQDPVAYPFRAFSEMYARCARLNWPFEPEDALMPKPDNSGEVLMNPLFEKHVRSLDCWSVGELFQERFPELAAAMKG